MVAAWALVLPVTTRADDAQLWLATIATTSLDEDAPRWRGYLELQSRMGEYGTQFIVRPALGFQVFEGGAVWLGYAWLPTVANGVAPDVYEQRIWQQWSLAHQSEVATFGSRSRLEERFMAHDSDVGFRFRQQFRANWTFMPKATFYLPTTLELLFDLNTPAWRPQGGFDHYRLFGGLGINLGNGVSLEGGYVLAHYLREPGADRKSHVVAISLSWNHNSNPQK
ncbi:MAG: DUF2490 domain-containing protein [Myxococcales bacterium]|nr:DUF2490 domain-containing protein [Myxococcales bacterium]MCB9708980.1 DUF2490 domain-containing protein [Myxococcales bacterium]